MVKLGEICTVVSGSTPSSSVAEYWDGNHIWITPAELSDDSFIIYDSVRHITDRAIQETSLKSFPEGTVILSSRAPIGKTAIAGCNMYSNQGFKNLICSESIYNKYLYFFLSAKTEYLNSLGRGATFKEISKHIVENIEISLPAIDEQKKRAAILEKLMRLIHIRRKQHSKLDQLVKSRFVEMFGDEHSFHSWVTCKVGNIAEVCVGIVIKPSQYYTLDIKSGVKAFRSLNIGEMYIKNKNWVYFTMEGHQKNQKSIVKENDVLIVRSGSPGTACVVTKEYAGYNAIDIIIAHPNCKKINPFFLAMFTNMPHGMNQIREKTGGAAQQHFNIGGYKNITIILPPLPLQEQFAAFVQQVDKAKSSIKQSLETLETLKKSLMQEYFG